MCSSDLITAGLVATATVALGATGYIGQFIAIPRPLVVVVIVVALGLVAAWGILESVLLASLFTLIEIGGLVAIVVAAVHADIPFGGALLKLPPIGAPVWAGRASTPIWCRAATGPGCFWARSTRRSIYPQMRARRIIAAAVRAVSMSVRRTRFRTLTGSTRGAASLTSRSSTKAISR